jgi:hypothetical protein
MQKPKKRATKRKSQNQLEFSVREKRRLNQSPDKDKEKLEKELAGITLAMENCKGPENILKYKVLSKKAEQLQVQLNSISSKRSEKEMHEHMALLDRLEKTDFKTNRSNERTVKEIPLDNRLHPPKPNRKNIFDIMSERDSDKWKLLRAHQKRYSVMFNSHQTKSRNNQIDTCHKCGVDRNVDKETAISVCPKCGSTRRFASHIFETKDTEKDDTQATRQQSLSHMQKFSSQFERGYPSTPIDVLEPISVAYTKFHLHDPAKVQACRTSHLLKSLKDIPKVFKRAPDRLTKELKKESIPEYTSTQLSQLLNQRNRLRTPEEMSGDDKKHRKSFSNQIYMRQLGRANHMEQSRLFPHAKTTKIHMERTRAMEQECEIQKEKLGEQSGMVWSLYPST